MKIDFRSLWKKFLSPPVWVKVLTFITTILSATISLVMVGLGLENGAFAIIAYILFGVAGISLAYSVYLIIPLFPKMKSGIIAWMEKYEFTHLLLRNFGFRTVIFAIGSFLMSLLFSGFNAYMGILFAIPFQNPSWFSSNCFSRFARFDKVSIVNVIQRKIVINA